MRLLSVNSLNNIYCSNKYKTRNSNINFQSAKFTNNNKENNFRNNTTYLNTNIYRHNKQINFNPVKTIIGGQYFLKKNFNIHINGFQHKDIDTLNWLIHGLVNHYNKCNGKIVKSIKNISLKPKEGNTFASTDKSMYGSKIEINRNYFKYIDDNIDELLTAISIKKDVLEYRNRKFKPLEMFNTRITREIVSMMNDYNKGKITSLEDKISLYESMGKIYYFIDDLYEYPLVFLEKLGYNYQKISKLSKEQLDCIVSYELQNNKSIKFNIEKENSFKYLYHEICHTLDIMRHLSLNTYDSKEEYPDILKEWFNNIYDLNHVIAISHYACIGGPDEFVAETYAKMIAGEKIPDQVKSIYRKYHGPRI